MDGSSNTKDIWPFTVLLLSISGMVIGFADLSNLIFDIFIIVTLIFLPGYLLIKLAERRIPIDGTRPSLVFMIVLSILFSSAFIISLSYFSVDSISIQGAIINLATVIILTAMSFHLRYFDLHGSLHAFIDATLRIIRSVRASSWKEKGRLTGMGLVILLIISAVWVWSTPISDQPYTELYVLGQNGKAMNYKVNLTNGSTEIYRVGISNHENARMTYILQAWLVDVNITVDNAIVNRMFFAGEVTTTLGDKEISGYEDWEPQWERDMRVSVNHTGDFRLFFLLFKDWVPAELRDPTYSIDYAGDAGIYINYATQNKIQNVYLIVHVK